MAVLGSDYVPYLVLVLFEQVRDVNFVRLLPTECNMQFYSSRLLVLLEFVPIKIVLLALSASEVENRISNFLAGFSGDVALLDESPKGSQAGTRADHYYRCQRLGRQSELGFSYEYWYETRWIRGMFLLEPASRDTLDRPSGRRFILDDHRCYMDRSWEQLKYTRL